MHPNATIQVKHCLLVDTPKQMYLASHRWCMEMAEVGEECPASSFRHNQKQDFSPSVHCHVQKVGQPNRNLRKVRGESGRVPEVMIEYIARKYNHPMCSQCSCICACCPSIPASLCHVTTWISDSDSNTPSMMQTPSDRCG